MAAEVIKNEWKTCSTNDDCTLFIGRMQCQGHWVVVNRNFIKIAEDSISFLDKKYSSICRSTTYDPGAKPNIGCIEHQCKEIDSKEWTPPVECCPGNNACVPCPLPSMSQVDRKAL